MAYVIAKNQDQHTAEDIYYWTSQDHYYHRCTDCVKTLWRRTGAYSLNNGFVPIEQRIEHLSDCQQRGKF